MSTPENAKPRRQWLRYWLVFILLVLVGAIVTFVVWGSTPSGELMQTALDAMQSDDTVTFARDAEGEPWLSFTPVDVQPTTGFIFYPGGRVLPDAYTPYARAIAEAGYYVALIPMPLNLAVFNANAAFSVIDARPEIEHWVIGGHSLGGAMAGQFVDGNPDAVDGIVILASYPNGDLSDQPDIVTASIYGSEDGLATVADTEANADNLPANTTFVRIEGGNHAQFGDYGPQAGDGEATISRAEQQAIAVAATLDVLRAVSGDAE